MNICALLKKGSNFLVISTLVLIATGCGQGFSAAGSEAASSESNASTGSSGSSSSEAFKSYSTEGKVNGGSEDDRTVFEIDKENMILIVHLPLTTTNVYLDGLQLTVPIDEIPGASVVVGPNAAGTKTEVTVKVPLSYVLSGVSTLPSTKLPNGDDLPAIADGELPSVAVQLSKTGNIDATVYLAPSVVGLYVNSPVNPYISLTFPIRNKAKTKTWGYFSTVPAKGNYQGGFFISVALPDDLARIIDDII